MKVEFHIGECSDTIELNDFVSRLDADCHDPFSSGTFDCPVCGKVHYTNSVKGKVVEVSEEEKCLLGRECELVFHDGLVDFYILWAKGDSQ